MYSVGKKWRSFFVLPKFHGHGVGYALMNKAFQIHKNLKVEVFKENAIGTQFYSRFGFKFVDEYFHKQSAMTMLRLEFKKDS